MRSSFWIVFDDCLYGSFCFSNASYVCIEECKKESRFRRVSCFLYSKLLYFNKLVIASCLIKSDAKYFTVYNKGTEVGGKDFFCSLGVSCKIRSCSDIACGGVKGRIKLIRFSKRL